MNNKSIIITGGSGFIGKHLIDFFIKNETYNNLIILDLIPPKRNYPQIKYFYCDIRSKINIDISKFNCEVCMHLAALCKEPGYKWEEYFETNYIGTKNVCDFAIRNGIKNIIFTSTMMVFRAGEKRNSEEDITAPDTAYGISKLLAEEVLLNWKNSNSEHRLRIIRPGVVFGKEENGNFTRLAKALKKNMFVYVGKKNTIKGSVYVKDVVNFLSYLIDDNKERIIYNFVFPEPDTIESICKTICEVMNWNRVIPTLPFRLILLSSYFFEFLNQIGLKNPIHHRRIEKLYYSTYLSADAVLKSGFNFSYNLKSAIEDWKTECDGKGLY